MKKMIQAAIALSFFIFVGPLFGQETAEAFFTRISEFYGTIEDYEADLTITRGETVQKAVVSYKTPNKLNIEFSDPEGQVLNVDNNYLKLWIPALRVSFTQELREHSDAALAQMASEQGLNLLMKNYGIGYYEGPEFIPLDSESVEQVIKLKLTWRTADEGFRQLEVSIGRNNMIRRIVGYTTDGEVIQFDFTNISINNGIPDARFDYELPPDGNAIINFLYDPEDL